MHTNEPRSTIGLKRSTKAKLDRSRAPGQCYDGFLCQLVEVWEEVHSGGEFGSKHSTIRTDYQTVKQMSSG